MAEKREVVKMRKDGKAKVCLIIFIKIEQILKSYDQKVSGIDSISFIINQNELYHVVT